MATKNELRREYRSMLKDLDPGPINDESMRKLHNQWKANPADDEAYNALVSQSQVYLTKLVAYRGAYIPVSADLDDCRNQIAMLAINAIEDYTPNRNPCMTRYLNKESYSFSRWGAEVDGRKMTVRPNYDANHTNPAYWKYDNRGVFEEININEDDGSISSLHHADPAFPSEQFDYSQIPEWDESPTPGVSHDAMRQILLDSLDTLDPHQAKAIELRYFSSEDQLLPDSDILAHPQFAEARKVVSSCDEVNECINSGLANVHGAFLSRLQSIQQAEVTLDY